MIFKIYFLKSIVLPEPRKMVDLAISTKLIVFNMMIVMAIFGGIYLVFWRYFGIQ